jgi:hypothetical protein
MKIEIFSIKIYGSIHYGKQFQFKGLEDEKTVF